jgi:predicted amino acid-binding ACT domain protein
MGNPKIDVVFSGNIDTGVIAKITALFSNYRINILSINMFKLAEDISTLNIICQSSSTTDEIDSFWNDLSAIAAESQLLYTKKWNS